MLPTIAELEYEAAQAEKRDKMNARLQIWSLFFALVSGFGLVSLQAGSVSYVVALFPLLAACLARYTGHSERVLDQVRAYILHVEMENNYLGYEQFNRAARNGLSGGHKRSLRDALLLSEALAIVVVVARLWSDHMLWLAVPLLAIELLAVVATARFLSANKNKPELPLDKHTFYPK